MPGWMGDDVPVGDLDRESAEDRHTGRTRWGRCDEVTWPDEPIQDWIVRGPRAFTMFLPWVLFIPLWWKKDTLRSALGDDETVKAYRGLCWGAIAGFVKLTTSRRKRLSTTKHQDYRPVPHGLLQKSF